MTTRRRSKSSKPKKSFQRQAAAEFQVSLLPLIAVGNEQKLRLREHLGMPRNIFGRLVNVSERAVADAESGKPVKKLVRPYKELERLFKALSEVVKPEAIGPWFMAPNEKFDGARPIELVERGEIDRLWRMAYRLVSGMPG